MVAVSRLSRLTPASLSPAGFSSCISHHRRQKRCTAPHYNGLFQRTVGVNGDYGIVRIVQGASRHLEVALRVHGRQVKGPVLAAEVYIPEHVTVRIRARTPVSWGT